MVNSEETIQFNWWRMAQLCSFQLGSAMGDILVTSIWNRFMISGLGVPAWPVGLLIALRYLLSPLSLWAGHRSDTVKFLGFYRTSYIWLGRSLILISFPFLTLSLGMLSADQQSITGWVLAVACFVLYGTGTLLSGSPFLALVRDSAPKAKQGLAISVAETSLIIFFAITGISFSLWLSDGYDLAIFGQMVWFVVIVGGAFWFLGILRVEKNAISPKMRDLAQSHKKQIDFRETLSLIWADSRTRIFFIFLSLATLSAWMQDVILEPFGAEVLGRPVGETTRFNSYWQTATVVFLVGVSIWRRKQSPEKQKGVTQWGLSIMGLGMALLALESFAGGMRLVEISLLVFGAGFGIYTFGGLSLMAVMSSDRNAGAYLGLWTISILIFKGLGNFLGSVLRDVFLAVGLTGDSAYGITFAVAAVGLLASVLVLGRLDVLGFAQDSGRVVDAGEVQAAGVEL